MAQKKMAELETELEQVKKRRRSKVLRVALRTTSMTQKHTIQVNYDLLFLFIIFHIIYCRTTGTLYCTRLRCLEYLW